MAVGRGTDIFNSPRPICPCSQLPTVKYVVTDHEFTSIPYKPVDGILDSFWTGLCNGSSFGLSSLDLKERCPTGIVDLVRGSRTPSNIFLHPRLQCDMLRLSSTLTRPCLRPIYSTTHVQRRVYTEQNGPSEDNAKSKLEGRQGCTHI